jgi:hypothetical protein
MAQASPPANTSKITPQPTGFSQAHARGGGEGGGQAMSVLLSWHEKVRPVSITDPLPGAAWLPTIVMADQLFP